MPIIKSAKKRVRTAKRASARNARTKRSLKSAVKAFEASGDKVTFEVYQKAQSELDTAVKKGVIHKNKAARRKGQLAAKAKAAGVKQVAKKTPAKKPAAKKSTAKKTTAKK